MRRLKVDKIDLLVRMRFTMYDAQAAAAPNAFSRLTGALSSGLRLVSSGLIEAELLEGDRRS